VSEGGEEQDKSEEASPFKLRRAREKGQVARGQDVGFLGSLLALTAFLILAGESLVTGLSETMRRSISAGMQGASDPAQAPALLAATLWTVLQPLLLLGGTITLVVLLLEVLQLRGLMFSAHPLKPDFSRISPAKGLKRIFSVRVLKEALKNILKCAAYAIVTWLVVRWAMSGLPRASVDAGGLAQALWQGGSRLVFLFILLALMFAAIDQVIVRKDFSKQMRMSRREVTREAREREGEPRLKQRRKSLHAEFAQQGASLGKLSGSDMVIVNPQHIAVGLAYDPSAMAAPTVTTKARDHYAKLVRRRAFELGIPIIENKPLARGLYASCDSGAEISGLHYREVADLYLKLRHNAAGNQA
jgi:flagellar biosynthetic protein FlhB